MAMVTPSAKRAIAWGATVVRRTTVATGWPAVTPRRSQAVAWPSGRVVAIGPRPRSRRPSRRPSVRKPVVALTPVGVRIVAATSVRMLSCVLATVGLLLLLLLILFSHCLHQLRNLVGGVGVSDSYLYSADPGVNAGARSLPISW